MVKRNKICFIIIKLYFMLQATDEQIIDILRMETVPALGCTEPVACALACARCQEELGGIPEHIKVYVSGNIYKNGMGVGIPGSGMTGLPIAAAFGCRMWKNAIWTGGVERGIGFQSS